MQLQLSLKIADRLHHDLLVRGEPLEAAEAARALLCTSSASPPPTDILDVLVREDRRFCWTSHADPRLGLRSWEPTDEVLSEVPFVALDLETTGAKAGLGKITEIGAVRIEGLRVVAQFHSLVNPQRAIPPMITRITGITESMVADAPRIEELMPDLLAFLRDAVVVAHNAPFDVGFLNYELHRLRSRRLGDGAVDTLPLSRALVPGLPNYRLKTVAEALGSPVTACHRALEDAQAVAHILLELSGVLRDRGQDTLSALRQHGRQSSPPSLEKLSLTRDLPDGPGTYIFVGDEGHVLLTGSAARLADEVRAVLVSASRQHRGLRAAVRSVERVDSRPAATPLEALMDEHRLASELRPPHNLYRAAPENYSYVRAGGPGPGLTLTASRRAPRWSGARGRSHEIVLGPFRNRSATRAVVSLLQQCYPIRQCPKSGDQRPCDRGASGSCLSPCTAAQETCERHDDQVKYLLRWLSGKGSLNEASGPLAQAKKLAARLKADSEIERAEAVEKTIGHLVTMRRSCERLADAKQLGFVLLWPPDETPGTIRLNLVLGGALHAAVSMGEDTVESALAEIADVAMTAPSWSSGADGSLAVPQDRLDPMLAVRRWYREGDHASSVIVPLSDPWVASLAEVRPQIVAEAQALLAG